MRAQGRKSCCFALASPRRTWASRAGAIAPFARRLPPVLRGLSPGTPVSANGPQSGEALQLHSRFS